MPGLLSSIFDGSSSASGDEQTTDAQGMDGTAHDESGEYQSDSSSYSAGADNDTHLDPSVSVGVDMGGSYETADGSTHSWENSQDVTLTTDTHVVTAAEAVLTMDDESFG